jgi:hypothetical protein
VDVIACESDEVDQQKHQCEVEVCLFLVIEIEPQNRHRHPAQIKNASEKIHESRIVDAEEFIWCEHSC